jgi:hypothetical protein
MIASNWSDQGLPGIMAQLPQARLEVRAYVEKGD